MQGETFGLVGESGCGKTTLGKSIIRLLEPSGGEVLLRGKNIADLSQNRLRPLRRKLQIVFQDPFATLNPSMSVYRNISRGIKIHKLAESEEEVCHKSERLMEEVGLSTSHLQRFPHQFSGGQRQRIAIARALAVDPDLIVLDEPTSALDVSVQSKILNLLLNLQREHQLTYLFITHNLIVARHICRRIGVMYFGYLVELGESETLFTNPLHPYTKALLSAIPPSVPWVRRERTVLNEPVPDPEKTELKEVETGHFVRC
jgi:oligopeptide/dipeptide ABC transporter ATP-binding protein